MAKHFIISYDIRDPRRVKRVHKMLLGYGIPLQFSVFYFKNSKAMSVEGIWKKLEKLIDKKEDDVRLYPVSIVQLEEWNKLGVSDLSAGIYVE
ncbi:CRISPR-associated endonuclease Cas2 [Paraferrimonas haliotis]|uniref:CRISPR-associated endonuclease Cas2 n=1 Tax=Paraferrimonas haliotis TaxID=2013866 RepID=UPI000BA98218|nr:CRISPR-associated endonuclease Cas2 [Paraferrimonas haliotis]